MPPARPYQVTMHQAWPPSTRHEASVMSQEGPPPPRTQSWPRLFLASFLPVNWVVWGPHMAQLV